MKLLDMVPEKVKQTAGAVRESIFATWARKKAAKQQEAANHSRSLVERLAGDEEVTPEELDRAIANGWDPEQLEAAVTQLKTEQALQQQIAGEAAVIARRNQARADLEKLNDECQRVLAQFQADARALKQIETAADAELAAISTARQQLTRIQRDKRGPRVAEIEREIHCLAQEQARIGEPAAKGKRAAELAAELEHAKAAEAAALERLQEHDRKIREFRTTPSTDSGQAGAVGTPEERSKEVNSAGTLRRRAAIAADRREALERQLEALAGFRVVAGRHARLQEQIDKLAAEKQELLAAPPSGPLKIADGTAAVA